MHKKARKQFFEDKQTTDMDYWNWWIWICSLRGVPTFVASGLDINGCVLSYFEGTANVQLYKLYTHYFIL